MKSTRCFLLAAMIPLLAAAADKKKATASPEPPPPATVVPKEAQQIEPYTWRYTDRQGQNWIYRKTPFGLVRFPEPPAGPKPAEVIPEGMTAAEEGDSIRFERRTPFGMHRWTRKKTELTSLEQQVWERDRHKAAPAKSHPQE